MVWASKNFLNERITLVCPVMELFHNYKKLMEDVWCQPELFYTFFAPMSHSLNPNSPVKIKPKMKLLQSYFTILTLSLSKWREAFLGLRQTCTGLVMLHLRNILLIFEFFIPIVSIFLYSSRIFMLCFCDFIGQVVSEY